MKFRLYTETDAKDIQTLLLLLRYRWKDGSTSLVDFSRYTLPQYLIIECGRMTFTDDLAYFQKQEQTEKTLRQLQDYVSNHLSTISRFSEDVGKVQVIKTALAQQAIGVPHKSNLGKAYDTALIALESLENQLTYPRE